MTSLQIHKEPEASYIHTPYVLSVAVITNEIQCDLFSKKVGLSGEDGFAFDGGSYTFDLGDQIVVMMPKFEDVLNDRSIYEYLSEMAHEANHVKQFIYQFIGEDMPVSQSSELDSCFIGSITEALASILL